MISEQGKQLIGDGAVHAAVITVAAQMGQVLRDELAQGLPVKFQPVLPGVGDVVRKRGVYAATWPQRGILPVFIDP